MINRECPKSAVLERMGSDGALSETCRRSVYAQQLSAVALASGKSLGTDITLRLDTPLSKGFQGESR
ncbi:hypothetical protein ACEYW6_34580 [Nostoc sp. UIC 10607]